MTVIHVDETYPGLPNSGRLSGTNGDLVGIMDIALPLNGWSIEYSSGNARIYRPGTGNRFRLHMNDDSSVSGHPYFCTVRGCENATDATTLVDPFPTVAASSDTSAIWIKSQTADTTARSFDIYIGETWVIYVVGWRTVVNYWEFHFFGDCAPVLAGDSYATLCFVRDSTSVTAAAGYNTTVTTRGSSRFWWARSYDGTVKSTSSGIPFAQGNSVGQTTYFAQIFLGPTTGVDTQRIGLMDTGTSSPTVVNASLGLPLRAWLPNLLFPLHNGIQGSGVPNARDTYSNSAYNPAFQGVIYTSSNSSTGAFVVVEASDTWTPPT